MPVRSNRPYRYPYNELVCPYEQLNMVSVAVSKLSAYQAGLCYWGGHFLQSHDIMMAGLKRSQILGPSTATSAARSGWWFDPVRYTVGESSSSKEEGRHTIDWLLLMLTRAKIGPQY
jgi:hypothetical protein